MNMGVSDINSRMNGASSRSNGSPQSNAMGKDDFLKLLMTQLQNQDPTNPVDNNAMLAQLAQFSALEQQQRTADLMQELIVLTQRNEQFSATSYIGKTVRSKGFTIAKEKDAISTVYYSTDQEIKEATINVYDTDGEIIYSEKVGEKQAGFYEFNWNGLDSAGKEMPEGQYSITIQAKTLDNENILVHTEVSGEVISAVTENGSTYLRLKDGRVVSLDSVYEVYDPGLKPTPEPDPEAPLEPDPEVNPDPEAPLDPDPEVNPNPLR